MSGRRKWCWSVTCKGKPEHRFPRLSDSRLSGGDGARTIFTCNDCMATRVVIEKWMPDGSTLTVDTIVEPPESA